MTLDTRWQDVDELLDRTSRTEDETRVKAVHEIAAQRFQFPTPQHPAYRTHINVPDVTMSVKVLDAEVVPDIVVVERLNTGETNLVMTVTVAIKEQVTEGEAKRTWARFAAISDQAFFLYVPVGYGALAKRICRKLGVSVEGFRTWRTTPRGFEINEVSEPASPLAKLMPPFVRKFLATP
jgi:hypothetical protein